MSSARPVVHRITARPLETRVEHMPHYQSPTESSGTGPVHCDISWCLPELCPAFCSLPFDLVKLPKVKVVHQCMAPPFRACGVSELRDNTVSCSESLSRHQYNVSLPSLHRPFIHSFILTYHSSFSTFTI